MILISSLAMWILEIKELYATECSKNIQLKFPSQRAALSLLNGRVDKRRLYTLWDENNPEKKIIL